MNKWCFPKIQQPITSVLFITRHKALLRVWHIKDAQQMFVPWKFTDWITRKPASSSGSSKLPDIWDREREKGGRRGEELKQDWHFGVWGNLSGSQRSLLRVRCSESGPFPWNISTSQIRIWRRWVFVLLMEMPWQLLLIPKFSSKNQASLLSR